MGNKESNHVPDSKFWKDGKRTQEYKDSLMRQTNLWIQGIPIHNTFSDECCPDFSCCRPEMFTTDDDKRRAQGMKFLLELLD